MTSLPNNFHHFFTNANLSQLQKLLNNTEFNWLIDSKDYWHKLTIVHGAQFTKGKILNSILKIVSPRAIMPIMYCLEGRDSSFLFQNNGTIQILGSDGLVLPVTPNVTLQLSLKLKHCPFSDVPIDPLKNIHSAVKKRINNLERIVDLRNFVNDPDLEEIYAPLTFPPVYTGIISFIKKTMSRPHIILLSHNELSNYNVLESLKTFFVSLKGLDLRFNQFTWDALFKFPSLKITDLWLDGNPLCDSLKYPSTYVIAQVKKVFPQLLRLDDVDISATAFDRIALLKNYIAKENYTPVVDHFLHHYFNIYESPNRIQLGRLYHPEATLSISFCNLDCSPAINQITNEYSKLSRNMLTTSDMTRVYHTLKRGPEDIMQTLVALPFVIFDPFSFKVDVPLIKRDSLVINVCGVFKDFNSHNPGSLFSFDRTFILVPWAAVLGEWKIINDIWAITNTTPEVADASFTQAKKPLKKDFAVMINHKVKDKDILKRIVSNLTKLNGVWTLKFLTDASWDLEMALQAFTDQYKANLVPSDAFAKVCDDADR